MHTHSAAGSPEPARPSLPDPARQASPGLPGGVWRDAFIEIVIEAYAGQISLTAEKVLRAYVRCTRPTDWSTPGPGPVAFAKQLTIAERLQVCRRTVRRAEQELEDLGLIERGALANGHRKAPRGEGVEEGLGAIGLSFAPMIARYAEIAALSTQAAARRDRLEGLRRLTSQLRFRTRALLGKLPADDPRVVAGKARLEVLPSEIARLNSIAELEGLLEAFRTLYDEVLALKKTLDAAAPPEPTSNSQSVDPAVEIAVDVSHEVVTAVTDHSNTTSNPPSVTRSPTPSRGAPAHADVAVEQERGRAEIGVNPEPSRSGPTSTRTPDAPRDPIEAEWSIAQLCDAASDEFRADLERERRPGRALRPEDFVEAAWHVRQTLGISQPAWGEACEALGPFTAALAVLVLDRNQDHPTHPVRSPGGALRGMLAKARHGALDLDASLFALLRRSRAPSPALNRLH